MSRHKANNCVKFDRSVVYSSNCQSKSTKIRNENEKKLKLISNQKTNENSYKLPINQKKALPILFNIWTYQKGPIDPFRKEVVPKNPKKLFTDLQNSQSSSSMRSMRSTSRSSNGTITSKSSNGFKKFSNRIRMVNRLKKMSS